MKFRKLIRKLLALSAVEGKIKRQRLLLIFGVVLLIALVPLVYLITTRPRPAAAGWWDTNWQYRKVIPISSHTSAETNEYIAITAYDASDTTKYQTDCGDVRFTKYNGELLPYTVATCGATTTFNVLFDTFPAGAQDIYIYYGNANAPNGFESSAFSTEASSYVIGTVGSEATTTGPVAYWKFDEGQGTTIYDNTSHKNNATQTGGTWQADSQCVVGKCMFFDGSDDVATVTNANPLDFDVGLKTGVTFSAWVRVNTDGENSVGEILDKGTTTYIRVTNDSSNLADLEVSLDLATTDATKTITDGITLNKWHHVAVGYTDDSDDEITVYIDGVSKGSSTNGDGAPASTDTNNLLWGGSSTANFHGTIDETKVYPFERTAAEVKTDYTSGAATLGTPDQKDFLSDGLVGYWKLDESATPSLDSSGNSNSGTWNGTAAAAAGKFGNGISLDGDSDYLNVGTSSTLSLENGESMTVTGWFKLNATNANQTIVGNGFSTTTGYFFRVSSGNKIQAKVEDTGDDKSCNNAAGVAGTTTLSAGTWYFGAFTWNDQTGETNVFLNGVQEGSCTDTDVDDTSFTSGTYIGISVNAGYFNGTLDDVRIYSRALSAADIRNLYSWAPGPVLEWKLDEKTGTSANDTSGNSLTGTFSGNSTWQSASRCKYGACVAFDGSGDFIYVADNSILEPTAMSISAWIKRNGGVGSRQIWLGKGDGQLDSSTQYWLELNASNQLVFYLSVGSVGKYVTATDKTITDTTTWHHVEGTWDGSTMRLYLDGQPSSITTAASGTMTNTAVQFGLGRLGGWASNDFNGSTDDLKIYNYARTAQQVVEDMNAGHPTGGSPIGSQTAYWGFDEQQGSTANNSISANSTITGSISGSTWKTKENCKLNGCLDYDGTDDVTTVTNADPIDLNVNLTSGFTASAWIYPDTVGEGSGGQIFYKGTNTWLRIDTLASGKFDIQASLGLSTPATLNVSAPITQSAWNHVALSWTDDADDEITIWVNGVAVGTSTDGSGAPAADTGNLLIGGTTTDNFDGKIDEFKVYNSELTQDQMKIDYNLGAAVKYSVGNDEAADLTDGADDPPVLEMKLDERSGTSANSTSGTYTGTLTGGPTWVAGKYGNAVNFDGSDDFIDIGTGPASTKTVEFWVKPASTTEYFVDLNGTAYVWASSGTTTATGFTSATIYVNGQVTSTIAANTWSHVAVTTGTALNASDLDIGRLEGTDNFQGTIDHVVLYDYARTAGQVAYDYNRGAPIGWWKLDECQGTTAYDNSGNGNNGTITIGASGEDTVGTCTTSSTSWGSGSSGKYSASLDFDGTDDYIDLGSSSLFKFTTGPFSVSAWIYNTKDLDSSTNAEIVATDKANQGTSGWGLLLVGPSEVLRLVVRGTTTTSGSADSVHSVPMNTWAHVAATFSGSDGTGKLYINGVLDTSWTYSGSITSAICNLQIGRRFGTSCTDPRLYFDGQIDDVRIYNYDLSAAQIKKLYNEGGAVRFGP